MACALASQLSKKAPGQPGFPIGTKGEDIGSNLGTKMKYMDLITKHSELQCKSCTPTGSKCRISEHGTPINDGKIDGSPDPPGAIVNSYIFNRDETLGVGLAQGMSENTTKLFNKIGKSDTLDYSEDDICRQYYVGVNRNDNGIEQPSWCTISDNYIKNMDPSWNFLWAMEPDSRSMAIKVIEGKFDFEKKQKNCENAGGTWKNDTCSNGFQNMKSNKLNPQNLTFDDDIPMKVYYGLLGVGGIYLLYQLSKKYGNKLNLD